MPYRADPLRTLVLLLLLLTPFAAAQESYDERFEGAWQLVADRYWNLEETGLDWAAIGDRYRDEAISASDDAEFYAVLEEMYSELGDDHSVFVPPERVEEIREQYGNLPCLPVLGQFGGSSRAGNVTYENMEGIGYLQVPDLASGGVASNVRLAVDELQRAGVDAFVLDLRGNPGGRLIEMMQVAGVFTGGFLWRVLTTWSLPLPYPAIGSSATELPLAILIDSDVHSAAEGLAGALQMRGRATVVGETTAGNVEAILPFCLRDGSQAWIATGVLAPIGGPTWEGTGVEPDLPVPADDALEEALRFLRRE